jgi:plastocyanin
MRAGNAEYIERFMKHMYGKSMKFSLLVLLLLVVGSILLAACTRPGTAPVASAKAGNSNVKSAGTVHMGASTFVQTTVTISKGSKLTLIDDAATMHIIQNGAWDSNNNAQAAAESGAPKINTTFNGSDTQDIGPFTTAGTFKLYCTVHPGMNLTVTVQ